MARPFSLEKTRNIGIMDTAAFSSCRQDPATAAIVRKDLTTAERLGAKATPILVVGDSIYRGVPWDLEAILERLLESDDS